MKWISENARSSTLANLSIMRIIDRVLYNKWFDFGKNLQMADTANSVLLLVKFIFKLHAFFKGSFSAERLASQGEGILMRILDLNKDK